MPDLPPPGAQSSPATARTRDPILHVLKPRLPPSGLVLEIAAGAGQHAIHMAGALPNLQWRPTDADLQALTSIEAWRRHAGLPNLLEPWLLDAARPEDWPLDHADAVVSINMIHISPWPSAAGLVAGAARILPPGGGLFLYGPFIEAGVETAPSNLAFDDSLRARNPEWGVRRLEDVAELAAANGLALAERIAMPANNLVVVFRRG
jgi:SAM-dependent methyltransferase